MANNLNVLCKKLFFELCFFWNIRAMQNKQRERDLKQNLAIEDSVEPIYS